VIDEHQQAPSEVATDGLILLESLSLAQHRYIDEQRLFEKLGEVQLGCKLSSY
jgi:hypothetical protein